VNTQSEPTLTIEDFRALFCGPERPDERSAEQQVQNYCNAVECALTQYLALMDALANTDPAASEWDQVAKRVQAGLDELSQKLSWSDGRTVLRSARRELERKGHCIPYQVKVRDRAGVDILDCGTAGETLAEVVSRQFLSVKTLSKEPKPTRSEVQSVLTVIDLDSLRHCASAAKQETIEMREQLREFRAATEQELLRQMLFATAKADPRTAPAWKLLHAAHRVNRGQNSKAWRFLIDALETDDLPADLIETGLREQFAFERSDHGLIRIAHESDGIATAGVQPEQYGYLLYGKTQRELDTLFDSLGADWVNKRVRELQARYPAEAAEMGLAELVQTAPTAGGEVPAGADQTPDVVDQYVTLDMMAGLVNRSKKTLERWLSDGKLPAADVEGGGGKPHEWKWCNIRESLEKESGKQMPERFPTLHRT